MPIRREVKDILRKSPLTGKAVWLRRVSVKYARANAVSMWRVAVENMSHTALIPSRGTKAEQFSKLLGKVKQSPADNQDFFYSIDCFKTIHNIGPLFGNYTPDYAYVIQHSFRELRERFDAMHSVFGDGQVLVIDSLQDYVKRLKSSQYAAAYARQIEALESMFTRPAKSFFEGLQRILFLNQFIWQTGHVLNGLGQLDKLLYDLYQHDLDSGVLTRDDARELIKSFMTALHEYYWFKSNALLGDTGQIIILGGREQDGAYRCNELTFLFIEAARELRLPDPKVLLRCTADMPQDLLDLALDCIATGIGAPLLSNDDVVIPAMMDFGYEPEDAYHYGTAACWEPLVPGLSCEANNIASLNFAVPFTKLLDSPEFLNVKSSEELLNLYEEELRQHIEALLEPLTALTFEADPVLSLMSPSVLERGKDFTQGGAKYNNLGLTSVGLGAVVNSVFNIDKLVFQEEKFSLSKLNQIRKKNYAGCDDLVKELKDLSPAYGSDALEVVDLTRRIMDVASGTFAKYKTKYGGKFKIGLSSPSYISGASNVPATFDGRKNGEPFSVHISSAKAIPTTELLSFAMKLDYGGNRFNGNVVDFITSPGLLRQNREKYAALLRAGLAGGFFQLQMNVVDSKTLIAAKADPTAFPNLVVRVWGFSAYFNDLPEEYKDVLITRALESEKTA